MCRNIILSGVLIERKGDRNYAIHFVLEKWGYSTPDHAVPTSMH